MKPPNIQKNRNPNRKAEGKRNKAVLRIYHERTANPASLIKDQGKAGRFSRGTGKRPSIATLSSSTIFNFTFKFSISMLSADRHATGRQKHKMCKVKQGKGTACCSSHHPLSLFYCLSNSQGSVKMPLERWHEDIFAPWICTALSCDGGMTKTISTCPEVCVHFIFFSSFGEVPGYKPY